MGISISFWYGMSVVMGLRTYSIIKAVIIMEEFTHERGYLIYQETTGSC